MNNRLKSLTSIPFLTALALLLLNDFYLKPVFHNAITGKLSDFCGLFIFPIFWSALFPKHRLHIYFGTAMAFIFWKSAYADSFIGFFSNNIFPIERVIDPTDLIALISLPIAWHLSDAAPKRRYVNPYLAGAITFFSFCATSMERHYQSFEQPQYVLFKASGIMPDTNRYGADYAFHQRDTLIAIEVRQLQTRKPVKDDDFFKTLLLKGLETRLISEIPNIGSPLPLHKTHHLTIRTGESDDILLFKGSRLNGKFLRKANGKIRTEGQYKNGIEDSIWNYYDTAGHLLKKKTFVKGETTHIRHFSSDKMTSSERMLTRADTIRNKYFHLSALLILSILMIVLIIRNYRVTHPTYIPVSTGYKFLLSFVLPIGVAISQFILSAMIPDHHSRPFDTIANALFTYVLSLPLFIVILFATKLRKKIDFLWYILLFALLYNFWLESMMLQKLISEAL